MIRYSLLLLLLAIGTVLPQAKIAQQNNQLISIEFTLPETRQIPIEIDGVEYARIDYEGARYQSEAGSPILPFSHYRVAIPAGATVSMQYQVNSRDQLNNTDLLPAIIVSDLSANNRVPRNEEIYQAGAVYPGKIVEVSEPYQYQRMQVVDVRIYPLQYDPASSRVERIRKATINISWKGGQTSGSPLPFSKQESKVLNNLVLNFETAKQWALRETIGLQKRTVNYDFTSGPWYRFPVTEEGIYRITGSFLSNNGISISSINVDQIQMFNHGGAPVPISVNEPRPQDLNEIAIQVVDRNSNGTMDSDDEILFYGRGVTGWDYDSNNQRWDAYHNIYATTNYYLFTFNQNAGKRIPVVASAEAGGATAVNTAQDFKRLEDDVYNVLGSGTDWLWRRFESTSDQDNVNFDLPAGVVSGSALMRLRFQGGSGSRYTDPNDFRYTVAANLNGQTILSSSTFVNAQRKTYTATAVPSQPGSNDLQISYTANKDGCFMFLDYVDIEFEKQLTGEGNTLKFYHALMPNTDYEYAISGMPAGTNTVWDVSDFANVVQITPLANGSQIRYQTRSETATSRAFYAFANGGLRNISSIEALDNSPNLRDPSRKGKILLITSDAFYDATAAYEDFKETQVRFRQEVERIRVSDIYREFSSGIADPTAIRDFIRYAFLNWSVTQPDFRPGYVFIVGDGSYDYRNIQLTDYVNQVPVFEIYGTNDIDSRVTDNFFTAFSTVGTNSMDPHIPIGRIHANSVAQVENYINKLKTYDRSYLIDPSTNGWQSSITFVADDEIAGSVGSEWFHLNQTEGAVNSFIPKKFDIRKIYLTDYSAQAGGLGRLKPGATADLLDEINRGTLLINFFGHGDPNTWAHEQVFTKSRDLALIANENRLPLWVAATCTWGKYDNPNIPSMSEEMIWSNAGGIGVIAASRAVFAFQNELFVDGFYDNLFNSASDLDRSIPIGDAVLQSVGGGSNDQKYHIFGDPTLQLADPTHVVRIDEQENDTLRALSTVTVSANVTDKDGNPLNNFNGKAVVRVYDAIDSLAANNGTIPYTVSGGTIFKGIVDVVNGETSASFIVPKSIKYKDSKTGRISIYAWSEDQNDAVGYVDTLIFNGTQTQGNDQTGPDISFEFPDQPDFFDGDYVSRQPTIIVRLDDESGINLTREVGHQIEIIVDGNLRKDVTDFFLYDENSFQSGELQYTLPALAPGKHTLTISAWDNLNNYSEEQLNFTTTNSEALTLVEMVNYPNPFQRDTHFTFQFQSPAGLGDVSIKVYTVAGRLIREIEDVARPGFNKIYWDGLDQEGNILANGVYLYKVVINDGDNIVEKTDKLAIAR